jgi:hypothetical protein
MKPRQSEGRHDCSKNADRRVVKILRQILAAGVQPVAGESGVFARIPERVQGKSQSPLF